VTPIAPHIAAFYLSLDPYEQDDYDERCGIREFDGCFSRQDAEEMTYRERRQEPPDDIEHAPPPETVDDWMLL
jgi:hypothetical protein